MPCTTCGRMRRAIVRPARMIIERFVARHPPAPPPRPLPDRREHVVAAGDEADPATLCCGPWPAGAGDRWTCPDCAGAIERQDGPTARCACGSVFVRLGHASFERARILECPFRLSEHDGTVEARTERPDAVGHGPDADAALRALEHALRRTLHPAPIAMTALLDDDRAGGRVRAHGRFRWLDHTQASPGTPRPNALTG